MRKTILKFIFAVTLICSFNPIKADNRVDKLRRTLDAFSDYKESRGEKLQTEDIVVIVEEIMRNRFDINAFMLSFSIIAGLLTVSTQMSKLISGKQSDESLRDSRFLKGIKDELDEAIKNISSIKDSVKTTLQPAINSANQHISQIQTDVHRNQEAFEKLESVSEDLIEVMDNLKLIIEKINSDISGQGIELQKVKEDISKIVNNISILSDEIVEYIKK